ncbi:uncharacterized protein STEHIDRAFT_160360 [Stereum hirsutum FP-91666 SS1]|uniref:uncharacterized protein n=1 Tax=Stereum hirsutum (strain FP-91666) TaxID=721885 RepID=UPI000444A755|nr:uncharacterized protein STEHIDRAFT_160360 [Stereum hirsutum FP-91666 SS1]EIM82730.1 hypothetical protein STEHIDRAFT_160360 [Stereum hirsutum FP-91666 SS1]
MAPSSLHYVRTDLLEVAFSSLFYGIFLVAMGQSSYFLCRQGPFQTRTSGFLMVATLIMFVAATCSWVEEIVDVLLYLPYDLDLKAKVPAAITHKDNSLITLNDVAVRIVYILSDCIVVQRAWILWRQNLKVKIILCMCILATVVVDVSLDLEDRWDGEGISFKGLSAILGRALIMAIPTLFTNLCATTLIAVKAWKHRVSIRKNLREGSTRTSVEKILALLVESGVFYCFIWVIYIIAAAGFFPSTAATVIREVLIQVAATYPCIIVCLVCLAKTHCDRHFTYIETSPKFAPAPPMRRGSAPDSTIDSTELETHYYRSSSFHSNHSIPAFHAKPEHSIYVESDVTSQNVKAADVAHIV